MTGRIGRFSRNKGSEHGLSRQRLLDGNNKSLLALLQLAILGFSSVTLVFILFLTVRVNRIVNRQPTFVQLTNGDTVYISERERNYRRPEVIRQVVNDWTMLSFNWDGTLPGTDEPDEGVAVEGVRGRVPFSVSIASFLLEPELGSEMLQLFATEIVPSGVFTGELRQVITIEDISDPRQIADGRWEVDIVSTRRLLDRRNGSQRAIPWNRTYTLQAVEIPNSPLGDEASRVEQLVYDTLGAGLQIVDIVPFDPNES
ncbi:hypothetical protein [Phormidium sp. FACHB-1136]|uniref:hypothetical protein n=1 Tax=Phormidium sp. FACHB-1136 TaxID=2692848 RepID=UPI001682728C|nr:hypothetical protein [Phormidium sp. FACHB-1136]MBD2426983.1 hypothetical protein [Phormidium sp. FACHB-1136]